MPAVPRIMRWGEPEKLGMELGTKVQDSVLEFCIIFLVFKIFGTYTKQ